MIATPKVSLVIVSRDRPAELKRLLVSLRYLQYLNFEVIVVSDADPRVLFPDIHNVSRIKFVAFDRANISAARNLGISHSSGQIVAFCDDDAVPEPTWLTHLIAPFNDADVVAAGGYVRGRNGISFQWKGRSIDRFGSHSDLPLTGDQTIVFTGTPDKAIKTEGTNCAFRKDVLLALGGFDENFHYYLDETDLNYRLGQSGHKTAIVPLAQVHHGFAASKMRTRNRAPKTLFQMGASKAWFCLKHTTQQSAATELAAFRIAQRKRLLEFMVQGEIEPRDVGRLLADLDEGIKVGLAREAQKTTPITRPICQPFQQFLTSDTASDLSALLCRSLGWRKTRLIATKAARSGTCQTVFKLSLSSMFHRMEFLADGFWVQRGGIFGRSDRKSRVFQRHSLKGRAIFELKRLAAVRPISAGFR